MSPGYPLGAAADLQENTKTSQFPLFQWDDETDMAKMEECVRSIHMDGLVWGASKLVPVGYGIKKLQIQCVVEDEKVGTDILEEEITKFEDYVSLGAGYGEGLERDPWEGVNSGVFSWEHLDDSSFCPLPGAERGHCCF